MKMAKHLNHNHTKLTIHMQLPAQNGQNYIWNRTKLTDNQNSNCKMQKKMGGNSTQQQNCQHRLRFKSKSKTKNETEKCLEFICFKCTQRKMDMHIHQLKYWEQSELA